MRRQWGQSMTEYLVVLGVTGVGLLAASSDVEQLMQHVRNNYQSQSSEMHKVQLYANPTLSSNPVSRDEGDGSDGEEQASPPGEVPEAQYPPTLQQVYDAEGNYLGHINQNNMLVDSNNQEIARCDYDYTGQCLFTDDGKTVLQGAVVDSTWVDDDGKPLPLTALSRNGAVVGFAYLYRNRYYDVKSRKLLSPQPNNLSASPTRRVSSYDGNGKLFLSGYESAGLIYSDSTVLSGDSQDFSSAKSSQGELLSVLYVDPQLPLSEPQTYRPCIVMPSGWSASTSDAQLSSNGDSLFTNPSSFIDSSAADCNGRHRVQRNVDGSWIKAD